MLIGLTGVLSAGKSTVAASLKKKGATVYDADKIVGDLYVSADNKVCQKIKQNFPTAFDGALLNKRKLAKIVFNDATKLECLEKIVHPYVIGEIRKIALNAKNTSKIIIIEVPLLFEKKLEKTFNKIIFVYLAREKAIERAAAKFKCSKNQVRQRIKRFMPVRGKMKKADYIIKNGKDRKYLADQVRAVWAEIKTQIKTRKN